MSSTNLKEAERVLKICNACRYREGFCAVFPAMELRRDFPPADLKYLANLCHNCRGCYYACQYAPPHEFALNFPKVMAALRQETYGEFAWPAPLKSLFRYNGTTVALITSVSLVAVLILVYLLNGSERLWGVHTGENSFYAIIPYLSMVVPFLLLALFMLAVIAKSFLRMWDTTGGTRADLRTLRFHRQAIMDVLRLKYLDGGGHGCNYPDDRFSMIRRRFHHAVFYGFAACLAATSLAFLYDHLLHRPAPYPLLSWPVILGTGGGVALLVGTVGLLWLKLKMDREPAADQAMGMDVGFLVVLFLVSLSGLALLALRQTPLMGVLLAGHLGLVLGLFITLPYGKFMHGIYRYAALVRNAGEQSRSDG